MSRRPGSAGRAGRAAPFGSAGRVGRVGRLLAGVALVAGLVGACAAGSGPGASPSDGRLPVVATTTIFADMVANVGGDLVSVRSLVPANGDAHTFAPRPSDMAALARSKLIVMNGLGLDDWLTKTVSSVAPDVPVLRLGENLDGVDYITGPGDGAVNPHLWLDVTYAENYVDRIAAALAKADPAHATQYAAQGAAYRTRLGGLDTWARTQVATIPAENRRFVAFHDAFPYFARAYGLQIVGVAVPAPGQDPSAGYTSRLIDAIRAANVKAIFSEAQFPAKLVQQLATSTGAKVVATLYDDSVGDPPISSYEDVVRWDVQQFVEALS